jgi:hypothetical protein
MVLHLLAWCGAALQQHFSPHSASAWRCMCGVTVGLPLAWELLQPSSFRQQPEHSCQVISF